MIAPGRHLLVSYRGCDPAVLDDRGRLEGLLCAAARAAGANPVSVAFHEFAPQGVTGVVVVEESHLSIHTWPELGFAAVDFFTCGSCDPERAHEALRRGLLATHCEVMLVERGVGSGPGSMRVREHREEPALLPAVAAGTRS